MREVASGYLASSHLGDGYGTLVFVNGTVHWACPCCRYVSGEVLHAWLWHNGIDPATVKKVSETETTLPVRRLYVVK